MAFKVRMWQPLIITFQHRPKERSEGIAGIEDDTSRIQVQTLDDNCKTFNIGAV